MAKMYDRCVMKMDSHEPLAVDFDGLEGCPFADDTWSMRTSDKYMSELELGSRWYKDMWSPHDGLWVYIYVLKGQHGGQYVEDIWSLHVVDREL